MILDIAIALRADSVLNGATGVLLSIELAQSKPGLSNINIIAKVKIDAEPRLRLLKFTNSPIGVLDRKLVSAIQGGKNVLELKGGSGATTDFGAAEK